MTPTTREVEKVKDTLWLARKTPTAGPLVLMGNQMSRDSSMALWRYHGLSSSAEEQGWGENKTTDPEDPRGSREA